jgi:hypothetical protein
MLPTLIMIVFLIPFSTFCYFFQTDQQRRISWRGSKRPGSCLYLIQSYKSFFTIIYTCSLYYKHIRLSCRSLSNATIGLYHPLDGITNPKYKLLILLTTKFFCKEKKALAFNWDGCCHLALCFWLIISHLEHHSRGVIYDHREDLNMFIEL